MMSMRRYICAPLCNICVLYMDPFAQPPPVPVGTEPPASPPLTKADLQSIRLELKSCTCVVEACQRQVHDVGRKLDKLTELFNFTANVLCWFTLIYFGGSWIFSHVKIGWA